MLKALRGSKSIPLFGLLALVTAASFLTWNRLAAQSAAKPPISIPVQFTDVREAAGIDFREDGTSTEDKNYLETMGTGLGWIDYDQDGLLDLYLVQSAETEWYKPPRPLRSELWRNNGDGTFSNVTEKAGVGAVGVYGQGRRRR